LRERERERERVMSRNEERLDRRSVKPGIQTSELWTTVGALAAALATCLASDDRAVKLAALGSLTCLGCVLGGLYIWSRTRMKA
jgi:hypothetical protein